ncbi:MAG TPA: hypothetical protein VGH28_25420 [Polyangiaceae bacterium]|jgi:hypothetical protein
MSRRTLWISGAFAASLAACFLGGTPGGGDDPDGGATADGGTVIPFQADAPTVYVPKVKYILTSLPATDAEVAQVTSDPSSFASLVQQWMQLPEYQTKMLEFFKLAFQQTQIGSGDFVFQIPNGPGGIGQMTQVPLLLQNVQESFARTAYEIAVTENKPFTNVFTTTSFMMTPPLLEMYGFMDDWQPDNSTNYVDYFYNANPTLDIVLEGSTSIPLSQTLDPKNANYMHWYFPGLAGALKSGCGGDPLTLTAKHYPGTSQYLHQLLYGQIPGFTVGSTSCGHASVAGASQFTTADFSDWRMVNIRQPKSGEATTRFFDVPSLHSASEMVLNTPRVGFLTPAFFANYPTNASNQARVTTNQAFIVATSTQVDGSDPTVTTSQPALDTAHASQQPCFGCHQTLDPSRAIFLSTYSYNYGEQPDPTLQAMVGRFQYRNHVQEVSTIYDFANALATHPLVPQAWAEKLCYWLNSQACATDDPAFQQIVADFAQSLSWTKLVTELVTSPITTNASVTKTAQEEGELVAVSRKYHLCTALDSRLGLTDVCGLDLTKTVYSGIPIIAPGLPSDGYGRGAPVPVLPNQPSLFFRAGLENICADVAPTVVDPTTPISGAKNYSSASQTTVNAAIADFVDNLMGVVPSDPRSALLQAQLLAHYQAAVATSGIKPTDALRSTFVVACLTPSLGSIGM